MELLNYLNSLPKWENQPACAGVDPEIFFPTKSTQKWSKAAVAICENCPALQECYRETCQAEAGKSPQYVWGIYAGMTEQYRKPIRDYLYRKEQLELIDLELKTGKRATPSENPRKSPYLSKPEKRELMRRREKLLQSLPQKKQKILEATETYRRFLEHNQHKNILNLLKRSTTNEKACRN